jgi:hypothetical protein
LATNVLKHIGSHLGGLTDLSHQIPQAALTEVAQAIENKTMRKTEENLVRIYPPCRPPISRMHDQPILGKKFREEPSTNNR